MVTIYVRNQRIRHDAAGHGTELDAIPVSQTSSIFWSKRARETVPKDLISASTYIDTRGEISTNFGRESPQPTEDHEGDQNGGDDNCYVFVEVLPHVDLDVHRLHRLERAYARILALLTVLETPSEGLACSSVALMSDEIIFEPLLKYLASVPAITGTIGSGLSQDGCWWVKFTIDIDHPLAWNVVQELGHVLNYMSLDERLPTVFMPVSAPPYMNGGPRDYLSWVIESKSKDFKPSICAEWLEGRLPRPVSDSEQWENDD